MEDSSYRNSHRPSDTGRDGPPIIDYQHHGILLSPSQVQQHLLMTRQSPPLQIQTSPSYASTTRSVSNRSTVSNQRQIVRVHSPATYEAERIAVATSQAKAAARSILLAGGTQASALTTAKAAAKSALQTNLVPGEKPPLGVSQNGGFRNRRKSKHQAEIIASMALSAANESFGPVGLGGEVMMSRSRSGFPLDRGDSDFPDDYTNLQSLGPNTIYGISPSVYSPMVELQRLQYEGYQERPTDEKQNIYRPVQTQVMNQVPSSQNVAASSNTRHETSHDDQNNIPSTEITGSTKKKNEELPLTRTLSIKEFFQRKTISAEKDTHKSSVDEVKTRIPSEMPMPRSSNSVKGSNSVKETSKRDSKEKVNSSPQSRQKQNESQLSSYSDCSISHTNSSARSYGESTYDNTAEYTKDTYESTVAEAHRETTISVDTKNNNGSFFFGNMDPFVSTFSEVFSCTPEPKITKQFHEDTISSKNRQVREERDVPSHTSYRDDDKRDQPYIDSRYGGQTSLNQVESDSLLHGIDIRSFDEVNENEKSGSGKNKRSGNNQSSMEQMVLKALLAISPKSSPTKRPKLNMSQADRNIPLAKSSKSSRKQQKSSFFGNNEAKASLSKSSSSKEKVAEANSSNQQESSGEDFSSGSEDSVTVNPAPMKEEESGGYKLRRFPSWFPRPKKTKE